MLLAVALQEQQVRGLEQGAAHGVPGWLFRALGSLRQGTGRAQAGLADCATQLGWRGAADSPWGQAWCSLGTDPL